MYIHIYIITIETRVYCIIVYIILKYKILNFFNKINTKAIAMLTTI